MRVVVALDSFKGSLGSRAAGDAVAAGALSGEAHASVQVVPVADGGEGTLEALGADATWLEVDTVDALGRALRAPYIIRPDGTAVVEAARTVGLALVGLVDHTVPPRASSAGVGEQLANALDATAGRVLLGLGGSACTDGGTGLLRALGVDMPVRLQRTQSSSLGVQSISEGSAGGSKRRVQRVCRCSMAGPGALGHPVGR